MIINNYLPKWRVEVMNSYLDASQHGNSNNHDIINAN